jgi:hypothetical protein
VATLAKRRPEAVKELEALQQQEREGAGEPTLSPEDFLRLLREDTEMEFIRARMDAGGLSAAIMGAGSDEKLAEQKYAARLKE